MILIRDLRLAPEEPPELLRERAARRLGLPPESLGELRLEKRSLDARRKADIHYRCAVSVSVAGDEAALLRRRSRDGALSLWSPPVYEIRPRRADTRPVVVGFGPAGIFAALVLARAGTRPLVIERGRAADERRAAVEAFRAGGALDPESNVQFGEGGAGTFSDGKLNTGIHDSRLRWVLERFVEHGAPESLLYEAKPHLGTDLLVELVQSLRREILDLGGEVRFGTRLEELRAEGGALKGAVISRDGRRESLDCDRLILAIGHSARDTWESLHRQGLPMERKPFAMGLRIEHRQEEIDRAQYGRARGCLPPADYGLHVHLPDGRGVFSFCMCPGGEVIAAASEPGGVVTNGMSLSARAGENANAALLVGLTPEDFPGEGPLAGVAWQRQLEAAAYAFGGGDYRAPAQLLGDFLAGRPSKGPGEVLPSYRPGVVWGELGALLPETVSGALRQGIPLLGGKLRGFDMPQALLTGPETRSSSPIRIPRDARCCGPLSGLYPCGEGAGYAGGISSAAVDGMRCAEALLATLPEA